MWLSRLERSHGEQRAIVLKLVVLKLRKPVSIPLIDPFEVHRIDRLDGGVGRVRVGLTHEFVRQPTRATGWTHWRTPCKRLFLHIVVLWNCREVELAILRLYCVGVLALDLFFWLIKGLKKVVGVDGSSKLVSRGGLSL